jgi:hypothetical protein
MIHNDGLCSEGNYPAFIVTLNYHSLRKHMKKKKSFKHFHDWKADDIHLLLGIKLNIQPSPALLHWIQYQAEAPPTELLEPLRIKLFYRVHEWNEEELAFLFISPVINTIGFSGEGYQTFLGRKMTFQLGDLKTDGQPDFLVASGTYEPEYPYFFLHEYKRYKGTEADPLGQLLIAMVAAQYDNNDSLPIYGCFVVGATWRFVLLEGKEYSISQIYDASDEQELRIIWNILHHTKIIIEARVQAKAMQEAVPKPLI